MTAQELVQQLAAEGVTVGLVDGALSVRGPADVRDRYRQEIAALKPDLLALLDPCECETVGGFRYLCPRHQDTPTGKVLVEPAPDDELTQLICKASEIFGGRYQMEGAHNHE